MDKEKPQSVNSGVESGCIYHSVILAQLRKPGIILRIPTRVYCFFNKAVFLFKDDEHSMTVADFKDPGLLQTSALAAAVYIVGAGPGDPDLLTVKAHKLLAQADVILFADSLVPAAMLQLVRSDAEIVRTANKTLEEILPLMIDRVRAGRSVIRLHSGDPSLYGAVHEQMQALVAAEIPFEVIPGISAFQAAAAKLKIELTVPGLVQTIILTRISGRTEVPAAEELESLAAHQASLCLYLSARHIDQAQAKLLQHYPADTPVAVCFRIGWSDEKIWVVPLEQMAALTQQENLIRTTLYLISPALTAVEGRSRLYNPEHSHLFRPK
jgi:precorrin-4/cobalt-precorrin-4 C11-methyltransferase